MSFNVSYQLFFTVEHGISKSNKNCHWNSSGDVKQSKQHKTISFMVALRGLVFSPVQL